MRLKRLAAIFCVCVVLATVVVVYQDGTALDVKHLSPADISHISLMYHGEETAISDPVQIEHILHDLQAARIGKELRRPGFGYQYRMQIFGKNDQVLTEFNILSETEAYSRFFLYHIRDGSFDLDYFSSLFS